MLPSASRCLSTTIVLLAVPALYIAFVQPLPAQDETTAFPSRPVFRQAIPTYGPNHPGEISLVNAQRSAGFVGLPGFAEPGSGFQSVVVTGVPGAYTPLPNQIQPTISGRSGGSFGGCCGIGFGNHSLSGFTCSFSGTFCGPTFCPFSGFSCYSGTPGYPKGMSAIGFAGKSGL